MSEVAQKVDGMKFGPMDRYKIALMQKHELTVHGRRCDEYEPRAADKGDHVAVYCGGCGVLLHRKERDDDE